jgi:integrase
MTELLKDFQKNQVNKILGKSVPFSIVAERYLKEISPSKSKNGRNDIISSKPVKKFFSDIKIDAIMPKDVYKYLDSRKNTTSEKTGKKLSGSSVNREKSFLSEVFTKAIRWGYVDSNPLRDIEGFSENRRERYITDEEFSGILKTMREDHADLFLSIYYTAQRNGRIYNLQWSQINLSERFITFKNTSKNKKVPDVLWINEPLNQILLRRKKNRRTLSPYVFYNRNMRPYNDSNIRKTWHDACTKAGVVGTVPYDLRHKAITDMKKAGHTDPFVGKVAGHSDPRTTQRYTHFSVEDTMAPLSALANKWF